MIRPRLRELLPNREEWRQSAMPIARGTVLGFIVGIVPGSAHIISSFLSYALEKRISKHPEEFGKGAVAGVAGPGIGEQCGLDRRVRADAGARPADRAGDRGVDGGAAHSRRAAGPAARHRAPAGVLGLHRLDVRRQPDAARAQPSAGRHVRQRAAHSLRLSYPLIIMFCIIGVYEVNHSIIDVWIMLVMGVVGYLLRKFDFDPAPLVLGLVIAPTFEMSLRQSLIMSNGDWTIFFQRPIAGGLFAVSADCWCFPRSRS